MERRVENAAGFNSNSSSGGGGSFYRGRPQPAKKPDDDEADAPQAPPKTATQPGDVALLYRQNPSAIGLHAPPSPAELEFEAARGDFADEIDQIASGVRGLEADLDRRRSAEIGTVTIGPAATGDGKIAGP